MIRINLLPQGAKRPAVLSFDQASLKILGKSTLSLMAVASVGLLLSNGLHAWTLGRLTAEWDRLQPEQVRFEKAQAALKALKSRTEILKSVKAPEAQWAPRLNLLSDALVSQLWFTSLEFGIPPPGSKAPVEAPVSVSKKPPIKKIQPPPKVVVSLVLRGSSFVADTGSGAPVTRYLQRLKEQPEFRRWFRGVELKSVEQRQIHQEQVSDFEILFFPTGL